VKFESGGEASTSPSGEPKPNYVTDPSFGQGTTSIGCYKNKLKCYNWIKQK